MNKDAFPKVKIQIPIPVALALAELLLAQREVFIVGGCVRDLLLGKEPKDWDLTTNAIPEEILKIFPQGKYENDFGTVIVPQKYLGGFPIVSRETINSSSGAFIPDFELVGNLEITTFRIESSYSDRRHPDQIRFAKTLKDDLSRRDFTINALALGPLDNFLVELERLNDSQNTKDAKKLPFELDLIDLFGGQKDLESKKIKAVGQPWERFDEDALRMMRAIRFSCQLNFRIEEETKAAIKDNQSKIKFVSKERIRDELIKIVTSSQPAKGLRLLEETGLLREVVPELARAKGVKQNKHHYYGPYNTVFAHTLASLEKCPSDKLEVRLAALLHDIGKPQTKRGEGFNATFHGHEYAGAKIARRILERLKFPRKIIEKTVLLVKSHMFYYNVDEVSEAGVRRLIKKVGLENIRDLLDVRIADRLGSGVPKAVPYKLRHFQYMVEKVSQDPLSVKQLEVNGKELMKELDISPGPKIGAILDVLLSQVLENPKLNQKDELLKLARELNKQDLSQLRKEAKKEIDKERQSQVKTIKKKHHVE